MKDTTYNRIDPVRDDDSFATHQMRVLKRRLEKLSEYIDGGAPRATLAVSAALVIRSLVGAFGADAFAEFARISVLAPMKTELGFCTLHDDDDASPEHRITDKSRGMCDECWNRSVAESGSKQA